MREKVAPMRVTLVGMDDRTRHMLQMFFAGPCNNSCEVVEGASAEISIVDMDVYNAEVLYKAQREKFPEHRFLLLSLTNQLVDDAVFVKKPLKPQILIKALEAIRKGEVGCGELQKRQEKEPTQKTVTEEKVEAVYEKPRDKVTSKEKGDVKVAHRSAMQLDEKSFRAFIGAFQSVDPSNPEQISQATYDPKAYLQGYIQSSCKAALNKNQVLQLDGSWKPLFIFPRSREIWLDADDKQLHAACKVPLKVLDQMESSGVKSQTKMTVSVVKDPAAFGVNDKSNFQDLDAFLWKVSLWTAQGRVPKGIDLDCPVYLRHWPNMTRLMLFPHAMRIAALMTERPRTLIEIARLLQVPQPYVFAFYSAARSLGIAGQVKRQADRVVEPPEPVEKPKQRGLFGKILDRLKIG